MLDQISHQPYIDAELKLLRSRGQRICYAGDLTGLPVSSTSRTYYGRLWLSIAHHPGDTVSCTQAEALVLAAEARTGLRLRRRTELLRDRIRAFEQQVAQTRERLETQKRLLQRACQRLAQSKGQTQERQRQLNELESQYQGMQLKGCPYALDVALERFYTGKTVKHSALLHFGSDLVTLSPPAWFEHYNGRQTIEAGIKESKQVFCLHHLKVRSEPAIFLQACFVIFAANFIRWASHWLADQALPVENTLNVPQLGVKRQVQVAAHVSAQVIRSSEGRLLKFSEHSAFAGKVLRLPGVGYLPPDRPKF